MQKLGKTLTKMFMMTKLQLLDNDFDKAYYILLSAIRSGKLPNDLELIGKYTQALYKAGVNPILYLTEIPSCYLHSANIEDLVITIPDRIYKIGNNAFYDATLDRVVISGEHEIGYACFAKANMKLNCNQEIATEISNRIPSDAITGLDIKVV